MKATLHAALLTAALAAAAFALPAIAEDVTIVGPIVQIDLAADGKSATAVLKDNKNGGLVYIYIADDITLDKFKDKRIQPGDEIRTRFEKGEKNLSKSFKKTAGC
ncbi:MAG TPA: hypothetical protein VIV54_10895 [Burkholderiales bacterium]